MLSYQGRQKLSPQHPALSPRPAESQGLLHTEGGVRTGLRDSTHLVTFGITALNQAMRVTLSRLTTFTSPRGRHLQSTRKGCVSGPGLTGAHSAIPVGAGDTGWAGVKGRGSAPLHADGGSWGWTSSHPGGRGFPSAAPR
jgi:hypothetical protein